jgi:hypothetical protein
MRSDARVKLSREAITDGLGGKRRNRQPRIKGTIISPLSLKVRGSAQLTASSLD